MNAEGKETSMRAMAMSWTFTALMALAPTSAFAQSAADILTRFKPSFKGVEYDTPTTADEIKGCTVERVPGSKGDVIGFAVRDAQGKLLRRFIDTNSLATKREGEAKPQTHLDQWSYFRDGFEVYREVDLDEDGTLDQVRWLNAGGTRSGDLRGGRLASWSRISAEEATKVLVQALVGGDMSLLETVMASPAELRALGLPDEYVKQTTDDAGRRVAEVKELQKSLKGWDGQTTWSRFDGTMPHLIPSDPALGLAQEILLYENGVIFVTPSAKADPLSLASLHVSELVRIGETWKFLTLPRAVDPSQPVVADVDQASLRSALYGRDESPQQGGEGVTVSPELMKALADHDAKMPADGSPKELAQWHLDRIEILNKVRDAAKTDDEKLGFYKQSVHDLAEAYRTGLYPQGKQVFDRLLAEGGKIGAFAAYRKILADFDLEAEKPGANLMQVQDDTLRKLEAFLKANPSADEVPDVLFQIANVHDFNGNEDDAKKHFTTLARNHPETEMGKKAAGAVRRIELDGKPLALVGPGTTGREVGTADYRGKSLLVLFWMSAAEPDKREIADLVELYKKHEDKNFDILSVNLDPERAMLDDYLKTTSIPWAIIHEGGGLDSPLANEFGIVSTPTMFLVDPQGKVVNHRIRKAAEIEKALEKPLAVKPTALGEGATR
jgi:peroxiredoxin